MPLSAHGQEISCLVIGVVLPDLHLTFEDYEESDSIGDAAVFSLIPTDHPRLLLWQRERFSKFTSEQRCLLAEYLKYIQQFHSKDYSTYDLEGALEYWGASF